MTGEAGAPIRSFAPRVAQLPVIQQNVYAGLRALHRIARIVIYQHRGANIPASSLMINSCLPETLQPQEAK